jgi:hypothetical protein
MLFAAMLCAGCTESQPPKHAPAEALDAVRSAPDVPSSQLPLPGVPPVLREGAAPAAFAAVDTKTALEIDFEKLAFDWAQVEIPARDEIPARKWYDTAKVRHYTYDRELIPPDVVTLRGQQIAVTGYIMLGFQELVHQFVLTSESDESLITAHSLDKMIVVTLRGAHTTAYTSLPVTVAGQFRVDEVPDPDFPDANPILVYHLDDATVLRPSQN